MWNAFFSALSAAVAFLSALAALHHARSARHASALPLEKALSCESRVLLIERSLNDQQEVLTELANRVKMMKVRSAVRHGTMNDEAPDPYKNPDAWRKAMNLELAKGRIGK
jgi:Mg2+ and Co2+ transporter CorA